VDVERQVEYWRSSSAEDFAAALSLAANHPRHALFFAHLSIEKMLKALVTRATGQVPPRMHDLLRLAELAHLAMTPEQREFLARFQQHCLAGRYPDQQRSVVGQTAPELNRAREALEWLQSQLP
jgi:HEPN domain-containing protein